METTFVNISVICEFPVKKSVTLLSYEIINIWNLNHTIEAFSLLIFYVLVYLDISEVIAI